MTLKEKKQLRDDFFEQAGPNARAFAALFDHATDMGFYIKDAQGRIIALNPLNCEVCNIRSEWDAVGFRSVELFPKLWGENYTRSDRTVLESGEPSIGETSPYPADASKRILVKDIYPLRDKRGKVIGTACSYRLVGGSARTEGKSIPGLRMAFDEIHEHYAKPLALPMLAKMANMPLRTFNRSFAQIFGIAPGKMLQQVRLNAARRMLDTTDKLVADIAIECGFYDQSHFTRIFTAERGMTPGQYRRRHQRKTYVTPASPQGGG